MVQVLSTLNDGPSSVSLIDRVDHDRKLVLLRGLEAGPGIRLELLDADGRHFSAQDKLKISVTAVQPADGSNVGTGQSIFAGKDGDTLLFRKLRAQNGVSLTTDGDSLVISGMGGLTKLVQDTTPQLGGNLDVNSRMIVSASGDITLAPAAGGRTVIGGVAFRAVQEFSLEDDQPGAVFDTLETSRYHVAYVDYRIQRGTAFWAGTFLVVHDGILVETTEFGTGIGSTGVTLTASLSSNVLSLMYRTTATGTTGTMTYSIRGW